MLVQGTRNWKKANNLEKIIFLQKTKDIYTVPKEEKKSLNVIKLNDWISWLCISLILGTKQN